MSTLEWRFLNIGPKIHWGGWRDLPSLRDRVVTVFILQRRKVRHRVCSLQLEIRIYGGFLGEKSPCSAPLPVLDTMLTVPPAAHPNPGVRKNQKEKLLLGISLIWTPLKMRFIQMKF